MQLCAFNQKGSLAQASAPNSLTQLRASCKSTGSGWFHNRARFKAPHILPLTKIRTTRVSSTPSLTHSLPRVNLTRSFCQAQTSAHKRTETARARRQRESTCAFYPRPEGQRFAPVASGAVSSYIEKTRGLQIETQPPPQKNAMAMISASFRMTVSALLSLFLLHHNH